MDNYEGQGYDHYVIITFNANGTGKEEQYGMLDGFKISVQGSPFSFTWTGNEGIFSITNGQTFLSEAKNTPYSVMENNGTKQLKIYTYTFTEQ
ncbi:MAG: hypothetical protein LBH98_06305 [Chitinispirillales bacterium]|nr:hypothetical protein [Chitinispirillales bacterium]